MIIKISQSILMRVIIVITILLSSSISNSPIAISNTPPSQTVRKFLIDWVAIKTPLGASKLNATSAEEFSQEIIYAFNEASSGQIQFERGEFLGEIISPEPLGSVNDLIKLLGERPRKKPNGYEKVITIGITTKRSQDPFGEAISGGDFVLLWIEPHSYLVFHEMAHNFNAGHAHSIECSGNLSSQTCKFSYMGDYGDTTGSYKLAGALSKPPFRVNGVFLQGMGLIQEEQIKYADANLEVTLKPIYPVNTPGTKLLYIPFAGSEKTFAVEYRAAVAPEDALKLEKIPYKNTTATIANLPAYGLQVRMLGDGYKKDTPPFPKLDVDYGYLSPGDTAIFVTPGAKRQGFDPGSSFTLPDGSVINFLSFDPTNGAKVTVTRPLDNESPAFELNQMIVYGSWFSEGNARILRKSAAGEYQWPRLRLMFNKLSDNRRITEIEMYLNERLYKVFKPPYDRNLYIETEVEEFGDHQIKLKAKDAAGNTTSVSENLNLQPFVLPKPFFQVLAGRTEMEIKVYKQLLNSGPDYKASVAITNLSSGTVSKIEEIPVNDDREIFKVSGITRNSKLDFTIEVTDNLGNVPGRYTFTRAVKESTCSKALCFVGSTFEYNNLSWKLPGPTLKLQQLVGKKWQTVASADVFKMENSAKPLIYSYKLNHAFQNPGTYTLRIFQDPFTHNGKFNSGYTGKPFTQKIEA
jgi:hypothetical protein